MMVISYFLFFVLGLGFGYAAPGAISKLLPLLFPTFLALGAFTKYGMEGEIVARFILALVVTGIGILIGWIIDTGGRVATRVRS